MPTFIINGRDPNSYRQTMLLMGVMLTLLVSACASAPIVAGDALHCGAEYRAALGRLNTVALEATDDVVLATDRVISLHDAIC